jgi:hypothetical protein
VKLLGDFDKRKCTWDLNKRSKNQVFEAAATSMPPFMTKMKDMQHNECLQSGAQDIGVRTLGLIR